MKFILISINPVYVKKILANEKTVEFRRRFNRGYVGGSFAIYGTEPIKSVIATATITAVVKESVTNLWKYYEKSGGVSESAFDKYFQGSSTGYAILLEQITKIDTLFTLKDLKSIGLTAPQSYRSITKEQFKVITGIKQNGKKSQCINVTYRKM